MPQELEKRADQVLTASVIFYFLFCLFSISLAQISGLIGLIALAVSLQLKDNWNQIQLPLKIPFLLFTLAAVIAIIFAESFWVSINHGKRLLEPLIFYWLVNSIPQMKLELFPLWNFFVGRFKFLENSRIFKDMPSADQGLAMCMHLLIACGAMVGIIGFHQSLQSGHWAVPIATLNNPMTLSIILMVLSLMAVTRVFTTQSNKGRIFFILIALVMITVLMIASRREAWLGFLAGMVYLIWNFRKKWLWTLPVMIALVYFLSPLHIQERMSLEYALSDVSVIYRLQLWQASLDVITDHPILGCGFGCLDVIYTRYPEHLELFQQFKYFHNSFIQITVDTGLLGLFAWLTIWAAYIRLLGKRSHDLNRNTITNWSEKSAFAALIAFLIASFFETHFYDQEVMMVLYPILAFPFAIKDLTSDRSAKPLTPAKP